MTNIYNNTNDLSIGPDGSIHQAITQMEVRRIGIVLVTDQNQKLLGTVTDGDIRRAVLADFDLDQPIHKLLELKSQDRPAAPITAPSGADRNEMLRIFHEHKIRHLPLLDDQQRIVDLVTIDDFVSEGAGPVQAVIMAGGFGTRLRPLTEDTPKAMLPVAGKPLMEIIVDQLRQAGIDRLHLTVHHQSEKIIDHFGDGQNFGVELTYVNEDRPLGTAGALGLMEQPESTMLVINGDILTQVDFGAMMAFHRENHAELTLAVQQYKLNVPYGVVECDGASVQGLEEKPVLNYFINAGIYLLEPSVFKSIPKGDRYDMTDLIHKLIGEGRQVAAFPIHEKWLDIGQHADYQEAQEMVRNWSKTP